MREIVLYALPPKTDEVLVLALMRGTNGISPVSTNQVRTAVEPIGLGLYRMLDMELGKFVVLATSVDT